ncbi:response regulator transcription factor [Aquisalimonas asiatica]|uniref:Two component transcriptional regulator, LuxR family n=1 Tax=Aquisalimonas asiatica TaxID=406100 RepID=A0A1H8SLD3_9GAMM|nr:response regulator [Aquisalimonas asiatica]SEO79098.1 two component transcriptional regulator, LuxR family [Aquisalimonas asiatica]
MSAPEDQEPRIYVVDDDADVRDAIAFLLESDGLSARVFAHPGALLGEISVHSRGCLVLDVRLPGMDGLQLLEALHARGVTMPVVFISGHGDIPLAVRAVQAGALDFLEKPFRDQVLLEKIRTGLTMDARQWAQARERALMDERLEQLTPRETEVMEGMLAGKLNKLIADDLGVSVRTVEVHRAHVLEKIGARNSPDMVRMVLSSSRYRDWRA